MTFEAAVGRCCVRARGRGVPSPWVYNRASALPSRMSGEEESIPPGRTIRKMETPTEARWTGRRGFDRVRGFVKAAGPVCFRAESEAPTEDVVP